MLILGHITIHKNFRETKKKIEEKTHDTLKRLGMQFYCFHNARDSVRKNDIFCSCFRFCFVFVFV